MARVTGEMRPVDEPLRFLLGVSRQPKTRVEDGVWLRLVDIGRALAGRRYATEGRLVLRIRDPFCPWNDGHFELNGGPSSAECKPFAGNPDLELTSADPASVYLGGNRFQTLPEPVPIQETLPVPRALARAIFLSDPRPRIPSF